MKTLFKSTPTASLLIVLVLLLSIIILLLAPEEETLGSGIRSVYVHVALTWTAMLGVIVAGILGLIAAAFSKEELQKLAYMITWIALALFGAGFVMSMIAAGINWGGVFWQEPRANAAVQVLGVGLVAQLINSFALNYRIKGLLYGFFLLFMFWAFLSIPDVLHPGNAARTSPTAMRLTFYSMFVLFTLAAGWVVWQIHKRFPVRGSGNESLT